MNDQGNKASVEIDRPTIFTKQHPAALSPFFYCPCCGSRQTLTASISWVVLPRAGQSFLYSPTRQPNTVVRQIVRFSSQTINRHRLETNEEEEKRKHRNEIKRLELESVRVRACVHGCVRACVCEAATLFDLSLSPPPPPLPVIISFNRSQLPCFELWFTAIIYFYLYGLMVTEKGNLLSHMSASAMSFLSLSSSHPLFSHLQNL